MNVLAINSATGTFDNGQSATMSLGSRFLEEMFVKLEHDFLIHRSGGVGDSSIDRRRRFVGKKVMINCDLESMYRAARGLGQSVHHISVSTYRQSNG